MTLHSERDGKLEGLDSGLRRAFRDNGGRILPFVFTAHRMPNDSYFAYA